MEVLVKLEGKSQKKVERHFVKLSPQAFTEKILERALSEELTEIKMTLDAETMSQLERLKELKPGMNTKELIQWMLRRSLKQIDPLFETKKSTQQCKKDMHCQCRMSLEIDHIKPLAFGGKDELSNMRLLCREHHKQMTIESFGSSVFRKRNQTTFDSPVPLD